jgi:hypothetical protein
LTDKLPVISSLFWTKGGEYYKNKMRMEEEGEMNYELRMNE